EESLPSTQKNWRNREMQLVNQACTKVLLYGCRPSTDSHILSVGDLARPVESLVNTASDKMERRVTLHLQGRTCMMGQDKDRNVIRRVVSPPPLPVLVRPRTADGSEHVSPEDPGSNILKATGSEIVVNSGRATVLAEQGTLERARWE